MPSDGAGVYSLPTGYLAVTGQPVVPSNHNPPLEDIRDALTARLMRSGVNAMTGKLPLAAATTAMASANLPHGTAPTGPANGDVWSTTHSVYARVNGITRDMLGLVPISKTTVSGSPGVVDFTGLDTYPTYGKFLLSARGVRPATDSVAFCLRVGTGATPTYETTNYVHASRHQGTSAGVDGGAASDSLIVMSRGVGNVSGRTLDADILFSLGATGDLFKVNFRSSHIQADGTFSMTQGAGAFNGSTPNAVRLVWFSGTFANTGSITLFGVKDAA